MKMNPLLIHLVAVTLLVAISQTSMAASTSTPLKSTDVAPEFDGVLLAASDADMRATGYFDGKVGRPLGQRDSLSVFPFEKGKETLSGQIHASNSVMGLPKVLASSLDGQYAYVIETRQEFPSHVSGYENLTKEAPRGSILSTIDISEPLLPKLVDTMRFENAPYSIQVSPEGKSLLIASDGAEHDQIIIVALDKGIPDKTYLLDYPGTFPKGDKVIPYIADASWHPSGDYIALNVAHKRAVFLKVIRVNNKPDSLSLVGDYVDFSADEGVWLASGTFTSNGNYYLMSDTRWGKGVIPDGLGRVLSIEFDQNGFHHIVDVQHTGVGTEGVALSHDDKLIAAVNLELSPLEGTPIEGKFENSTYSSLSLLTFDNTTGHLEKVDEQRFPGVLPENAVFDYKNEMLAVTIFYYQNFEPNKGFVGFWKIDRSGKHPKLVQTTMGLPVTRGVHDLDIAPRYIVH